MSEPNNLPRENEEKANVNDILNDIKNAITSPDEGDDVIVLSKKVPDNKAKPEANAAEPAKEVVEDVVAPVQAASEAVEEAKVEPAVEVKEAVAEVQPVAPEALLSNEVMLKTREMVKQVAANRNENNQRSSSNASSLEQMIIEAIKPQMTEWLNDNLPSIVKEIVEKEIKKVMANE